MERSVLERTIAEVNTSLGNARVKICTNGETIRYYPEYDSVSGIARETGRPFAEVYELVKNSAVRTAGDIS